PQCKDEYNDIDCPMDEEYMRFAAEQAERLGADVDGRLLRHLGFLFARDPLVIFPDKIYVDDTCNNNHFEVRLFGNKFIYLYRTFRALIGILFDSNLLQALIQILDGKMNFLMSR
ncbi:MAG: hypothetical protein EOO43_26495, partial [Flavobacterium sp.]